jgi:hypothetical protein
MDPTAQGLTGYTTTVITAWGRETYQVWLERTACAWVARIVTLPNRIWAQAGGREAIKFHGVTREEAEAEAVRFIEEERILTKRRVWLPRVDARTDQPGVVAPAVALSSPRSAFRTVCCYDSVEAPKLPGLTANLSRRGSHHPDRPTCRFEVRIDLRFFEAAPAGKVM